MNRESSRSHSVLTTIIESKSLSHTGVWNMKTSRFHIIDLAGSERSKNTNTVGERLKEAGMINKSLSALGNVIYSLVDLSEGKSRHVPYRDQNDRTHVFYSVFERQGPWGTWRSFSLDGAFVRKFRKFVPLKRK